MGVYGDKAQALFKEGYNCAQAVLLAFCEELSLDVHTAARLSSSFGGGVGRLREVCGAVSGMCMVAGVKFGCELPRDANVKMEHYALIQRLAGEFREKNGAIVCRELLGLPEGADVPKPEERTQAYYEKRPCAEYVKHAADIIGRYFERESGE